MQLVELEALMQDHHHASGGAFRVYNADFAPRVFFQELGGDKAGSLVSSGEPGGQSQIDDVVAIF